MQFMKSKLSLLLLLCIFFFSVDDINSQKTWTQLEKANYNIENKEVYFKKNFPSEYEIVKLNVNSFITQLQNKSTSKIILLPNDKGILNRFLLKETSNFDEALQAKFPNIKSYTAQGIDDATAVAKISIGTDGFHGVIFSGKQETVYIDPYTKDNTDYIVYKRSSLSEIDETFKCEVEAIAKTDFSTNSFAKNANDGKLRTFRLALACSGEYAQFHLGAGQQNIPDSASDQVKKEAVLSAMNTSITRVNAVFEKDLSVKLELVGNNDDIIFLDPATDGMSDNDPDALLEENQVICDTQIGSANYDIGHVFSTSGGTLSGVAGLGVVCISAEKAKGVTGLGSPVGDAYDIDLVIHELGHQFGATHTQNNSCQRSGATAVEPGSGSTIMGYAGICAPNVIGVGASTGNSDDHFHAVSIAQMWNLIQTSANCGVLTDTNNAAPTANAGLDYSIPKSTPYKLEGTATDADGLNSLTYNWEQIDNEVATMPPLSTNTAGPMFRSLPSKDTSARYMPDLSTVVAGNNSSTWEVLSSVARELNFSFLVRDNNAGGGSTARDDMSVSVLDITPFTISEPSLAVTWNVGSTQTITWNKGTTDVAPVNCTMVNIKLSTDGGVTFPITLKSNTPNDGSENIIIPDNATSTARIMVEAVDNIFYNVNTTNFSINSTDPTFVINNTSGAQVACNLGNETVSYILNFDFVNGFSETVTLSASGEPSGSSVVFNPTIINSDGNVTMTVSSLDNKTANDYLINVLGTSASLNQNIDVALKLTTNAFNDITLSSPVNNASDVGLSENLSWEIDTNATSYDVEIATEVAFTNIVSSGNVSTNSYTATNLSGLTEYFWRVKPKNDCGEGNFASPFSFTTLNATYCASTFTDEAGGSEHITNVTFVGINNNSGNDTSDGYEDFTSINANVLRGDTHQISVTMDTGGFQDHCYVFIDWNQDFIFDINTERYDLGSEIRDVGTRTFNISVPSNARFGQTRMRVVIEYDDPDNDFGEGGCDTDHLTEWGETEDYSITVVAIDGYSILTTSETCVDENDGIIQIDNKPDGFTRQLTITGPSTSIDQNFSGTNFFLFDALPGNYEVCIFTQELNITNCFEVTIEESQPISLKLSAEKSSNTYSFNIEEGTAPFSVYLNNELLGVSSNKEFDLEITGTGKLEVKTAKDCEGLFQKSIGAVLLKQNPVSDFIEFQLPLGIEQVTIETTIFDVNGKLVFNQFIKREEDNLQIPFSRFAKGVYILKLSLENTKPFKILKQ